MSFIGYIPSLSAINETPIDERSIGRDLEAIQNTVMEMRRIIDISSKNPYVREWARTILQDVLVNQKMNEAHAIHNFVRDNVRYTRDPYGWEYIQTPPILLAGIADWMQKKTPRPIGDCDDMTTLSLSLMKAVGFPVIIKTVGYQPNTYSHVYGLVMINNQWYPTDTVRPDRYLGWESSGIQKAMEVEV